MPRRKGKEKFGEYIGVRLRSVDKWNYKKLPVIIQFKCRLLHDEFIKKSLRDVINYIKSEEKDPYKTGLLELILNFGPRFGETRTLMVPDGREVNLDDTVEKCIEYKTIRDIKVGYLDLSAGIIFVV